MKLSTCRHCGHRIYLGPGFNRGVWRTFNDVACTENRHEPLTKDQVQ